MRISALFKTVYGVVATFAILSLTASTSLAEFHNTDVYNRTGNIANDFHLVLVSDAPIMLAYQCCRSDSPGGGTFPPAVATGDGTNQLTLNWSGFQINGTGDKIHVGYEVRSTQPICVKESWFTFSNDEVLPRKRLASVHMKGGGTNYRVARVRLYSDMAGTSVEGNQFVEDIGTDIEIANRSPEGVMYASIAQLDVGPTVMPYDQLNSTNIALNAQLDAVQGPITAYVLDTCPFCPTPVQKSTWGDLKSRHE